MRLYLRHKWIGAVYIEFSIVHYNSLLFSLNKSGMEWVCEFPFGSCILTSARALRAERSTVSHAVRPQTASDRNGTKAVDHSNPVPGR